MNRNLVYFEPGRRPTGKRRPPELQPSRRKTVILAVLGVLSITGYFLFRDDQKIKPEEITNPNTNAQIQEEKREESRKNITSHIVSEGDIPADVFAEYGKLDANEMEKLLLSAKDTYDFTSIKIGQKLEFIMSDDGKTEEIKYYPDTENVVTAIIDGDSFQVTKENIPYEIKEETLEVKIDEFLYKDAMDAGLSEASILEIADVFSFDIDFTTEIQEGDEMKVIYEKRTLHGQSAPDGKILAAKFINTGQEYRAYHFESDGVSKHYDAEGHELMRQFLRAPLSYRAITSGYTGARRHPITKKVSAHYQIDYAAPSGTPVVATARGTVASAGYEGGWGNIVRLTHDNGYTTHYGHLSGYGKSVRSGADVSQGQVVGYVGSTGWSTGAHLDYGMRLNGNPINPLSLQLPKGNPLSGAEMERFQETKKKYDELLK